ncbi:putative metal-dependent peptidase [Deinobacterium chartae]|uniref:Putative metal-dependent peptidase n=1 Tax=Deinobacterium chartae TaxID=521158 RepID=A0A841I4B4_9DEIO|nr:putative metal-dependent peptidase [Deinobacterium chartae]
MPAKRRTQANPADEAFHAALEAIEAHPLLSALAYRVRTDRSEDNRCPDHALVIIHSDGHLLAHPRRRAAPAEWIWALTHALLHLGLGHLEELPRRRAREWQAACDVYVTRFLHDLGLGLPPPGVDPARLPALSEERLYQQFVNGGIPAHLEELGTAGSSPDMRVVELPPKAQPTDWAALLARGIASAVAGAVDQASGLQRRSTAATRARDWFVSSYPLLGALAAGFEIIEDPLVCQRLDVSVAAVSDAAREIYLNPAAGLSDLELRFVMAHELLHVGLRHGPRAQGRDPYLWNVACDYIINAWLIEMQVGEPPAIGLLHDPELAGMSAEEIYDRICRDLRRYRKLATLRGAGLGDLLAPSSERWWERGAGCDLDAFYRRALASGLEFHQDQGRGLLPAGLVEEIRALSQPPVPWDVQLARWFDARFPPVVQRRSYARPSRRQSATPDLPRPRLAPDPHELEARTFAVLIDTSGSMDRLLLAKALGAAASYALSRDVPLVRVVFCDAAAHDAGYLAPEEIAGRVRVRGRGGTVLQPGVDLLEQARDFPERGPILVITDGECEPELRVRRDHAFLVPRGARLTFRARGPVFYFE